MRIIIGIDSGTQTGFAVWDRANNNLLQVSTLKIHQAMEAVLEYKRALEVHHEHTILVRVEDARLRKWFGNSGREKLQGAGSVKRDAVIWEDFLTDHEIPFEMVAPKKKQNKSNCRIFQDDYWMEGTHE